MLEYTLHYHSHNEYEQPVMEASYHLLVQPCDNSTQTLLRRELSNSFHNKEYFFQNIFGFEVVALRTANTFRQCNFDYEFIVRKLPVNYFQNAIMSIEQEIAMLSSDEFRIANHLYLQETQYTHLSKEQLDYFPKYAGDQPLFDFLTQVNSFLHNQIKYDTSSTHVHTVVDEVVKMKKGVCQDFAHLFISICRHNKIPSRYVSGYLNPGKGYKGTGMMHAWVEAFVPGPGWVGYDPSNHLMADEHYVKVAHGCDYTDCPPIKGVLRTTGNNETTHSVKVSARAMQQ